MLFCKWTVPVYTSVYPLGSLCNVSFATWIVKLTTKLQYLLDTIPRLRVLVFS